MINPDENEEWRPVVGFEQYYHVSNTGKLKRIKGNHGTCIGRIQKPNLGVAVGKEYIRYSLCVNNKVKIVSLHRIIYEAFVGPIPEGMQINHKNGIKHDNSLENLEVVSPSENKWHAVHVLGKKPPVIPPRKGEKSGMAVLTNAQAAEIRRLCAAGGITHKQLAAMFSVSASTIGKIVYRWTYLE
jgi:hypothetical protein